MNRTEWLKVSVTDPVPNTSPVEFVTYEAYREFPLEHANSRETLTYEIYCDSIYKSVSKKVAM